MEPIEERSEGDGGEVSELVNEAKVTIEGVQSDLLAALELAEGFHEALGDVSYKAGYLRELLPKLAEHRAEVEASGWQLEQIEELVATLETQVPDFEELEEGFRWLVRATVPSYADGSDQLLSLIQEAMTSFAEAEAAAN